jgi:hypothetical protein
MHASNARCNLNLTYVRDNHFSINQEDYDQFWAWFGTILYKIRNHQKHILPMWIKGTRYHHTTVSSSAVSRGVLTVV